MLLVSIFLVALCSCQVLSQKWPDSPDYLSLSPDAKASGFEVSLLNADYIKTIKFIRIRF